MRARLCWVLRMPVPVWDTEMAFLNEPPPDTAATVVSDDIWKKFELEDVPLGGYRHYQHDHFLDDPASLASSLPPAFHYETPMMMHFDKLNCQASREIRHHDCMWAGLCISKDHNRTLPAKKDSQLHRRIPAGRSLLIPKSQQQHQQHQQALQQKLTTTTTQCKQPMTAMTAMTTTKNLDSDGDSTRPDTPQSSESESESEEDEEEDEEEEDEEEEQEQEEEEAPVFRHEQISIHDVVQMSMPVSEVTGQQVQRRPALFDRRKEEEAERLSETVIRNTLMSDHCYYSNQQPNSKKLEHLGVQTPSDSGEYHLLFSFTLLSCTPPILNNTSCAISARVTVNIILYSIIFAILS